MTRDVEQVDQSDMQLSRRDLMGSSAVVAAGAMGIGMMGAASAQDGPTDEISGLVEDTDGNAVDGATVVAVPHDESLDALVTTTDANGAYSFQSGDLHPNSNLYHVVARDGTESDPFRSQQNYPFIAAVGELALPDSGSLRRQYAARLLSGYSDSDTVDPYEDSEGSFDASAVGGPTYDANAINGEPAVGYDGVDDAHDTGFNYDENTDRSMYFVINLRTTDNTRFYGARDGSSAETVIGIQNGSYRFSIGDATATEGSFSAGYQIWSWVAGSGTAELYLNDGTSPVASTSYTGSGVLTASDYIGARNRSDGSVDLYMDCQLPEILDYQASHGDGTRLDVVSYLNDIYGVF